MPVRIKQWGMLRQEARRRANRSIGEVEIGNGQVHNAKWAVSECVFGNAMCLQMRLKIPDRS
jgi:hypothetical protein